MIERGSVIGSQVGSIIGSKYGSVIRSTLGNKLEVKLGVEILNKTWVVLLRTYPYGFHFYEKTLIVNLKTLLSYIF